MVICEMCGKEVGRGIRIRVDKAVLLVGPECTRFGTPLEASPRNEVPKRVPGAAGATLPRKVEQRQVRRSPPRETDPLEARGELVLDYSVRILRARNSLGLKQEELAAKLNEKKSVIRELETGTLVPSDALVRKLEKTLKITLTEKVSTDYKMPSVKRKALTLGDLMKD